MCKYRKQLLVNNDIDLKVKEIFKDIESKGDFNIDIMETDKNHIHLLVSYPPKVSISSIVRKLKQESTINLWKQFPVYLSKHFWKVHTFWSDGYFVSLYRYRYKEIYTDKIIIPIKFSNHLITQVFLN